MPLLTRLIKGTEMTEMAPSLQTADIPTLGTLYKANKLSAPPPSSIAPISNTSHNTKISLVRTDITTLSVTAIVNAANESLLGGGGVDGAIHRAAGRGLVEECRTLDGCDTGSAKITGAYNLPCQHVIHAVGPVYYSAKREGEGVAEALLGGCYTTALDLLDSVGGGSIAFSALSTGIYGYPSDEAAEVAVGAVRQWLDEDSERAGRVERIVFCSFLEKDERAYEEVVPRFFPPAPMDQEGGSKGDENERDPNTASDDAVDSNTEKEATGSSMIPELPDVPKEEPKEPGQPEHKKAKLGDDGQK